MEYGSTIKTESETGTLIEKKKNIKKKDKIQKIIRILL